LKELMFWMTAILAMAVQPHSNPVEATTAASASKAVYVEVHGPAPLAKRFRAFFSIALEDAELRAVQDRSAADFIVDVTIDETTDYQKFYEYAYEMNASGSDHQSRPIKFSGYTRRAADAGYDLRKEAVSAFSTELTQSFRGARTVYMGDARANSGQDLAEKLKLELERAGYKLAAQPNQAEIAISNVRLGTCIAPLAVRRQRVKAVVSGSGSRFEANGDRELVKAMGPPLAYGLEGCSEKAREYISDPTQDGFWKAARSATEFMQK
jgi:hypothetical protein